MKTSFAGWGRTWWPWALALALAGLLAACGAQQTTLAPAATATEPAASASPAAPTVMVLPPTTSPADIVATGTIPATLAASALAVSSTAPAAFGPTASVVIATTDTPDPAVTAVLAYLDARARTDAATATGLSCKAWKSKALTEVTSFRSMNAKLVGVTCQVNGSASRFTLVGCGGKMVTTYGTETRDWDLSSFVYQVTLEDGQWKMCGYH